MRNPKLPACNATTSALPAFVKYVDQTMEEEAHRGCFGHPHCGLLRPPSQTSPLWLFRPSSLWLLRHATIGPMMLAYTDMPLKRIKTILQKHGSAPNFCAWKCLRSTQQKRASAKRLCMDFRSTQQKRASDFSGEISAPFVLRSITEQKTSII